MADLAAALAASRVAMAQMRAVVGEPIVLNGQTYIATVKQEKNVSEMKSAVHHGRVNVDIITCAVTAEGVSEPANFVPLVRQGRIYKVGHVDPHVVGGVIASWLLEAFYIPYEAWNLFTPSSASGSVKPNKSVPDVVYSSAGTIDVYFEPMRDEMKLAMFGNLDTRTGRLFSTSAITMKSVLKDGTGDIWEATSQSEYMTSSHEYVTQVKHLSVKPSGVT